jgi:hypothetical protein
MANPSTTGPSGAGTEVLRRFHAADVDDSPEVVLIDGDADHIYTIVSLFVGNRGGSETDFYLRFYPEGTGSYLLLVRPTIPAAGIFVLNDKISIAGVDELRMTTGGQNCDVYCTYIDQHF